MFKRLRSLLQEDGPSVEENRFERVQVAACTLLLEVAHSDGHYQSVEAKVVQDLLANTFGLSPAAIAELIEYAQTQREDSSDLFQFAREINAHFSREEKADVMEGIWRVIYADGTLDKYEDALARQLATLLRLDHKDVIDRKLKVLEEIKNQGLEDGG
ncbi:MAG: TerB family tellurite resistance protein [Desulfuromonadales bacterium]|jgi:uncharacterized tellurite resistance protein B-like protein